MIKQILDNYLVGFWSTSLFELDKKANDTRWMSESELSNFFVYIIMIVISNNKINRLTFGSSRFTRIPEAGLMLVTGFWLPVEEVLIYSHKEKSPAPWGPCGPIGPWEPLNPWGPIAPWDPLNPWGPAGPIVPWEPFTPGGPTGPWRLLTFSTWKENKCSGHGSWKAD